MKDIFIFEHLNKENKKNILRECRLDKTNTNKLNNILIEDLYLDFVNNYLLNKPFLVKIKNLLKDFVLNKDNQYFNQERGAYELQIEIEKIIFENTKGPINTTLLNVLHTTKTIEDLEPAQQLFIERFKTFKSLYISYSQRFLNEFLFFSYLLESENGFSNSNNNVYDLVCYIFVENLYTNIYKNFLDVTKKAEVNVFDNKSFLEFKLDYDTPYVEINDLLNTWVRDIRFNIHLFYENNIIKEGDKEKNYSKYLHLIGLFNKISKFDLFKDSYLSWLDLFKTWNTWIKKLNPTNEIFTNSEFLKLEKEIVNNLNKEDHIDLSFNNKVNQGMLVNIFFMLLGFAETSKLLVSNTLKYSESKNIKSKKYIFFSKDLQDLDKLYVINKKLDLPFVSPPKDFKFELSYLSTDKFDYDNGGYYTKNLQSLSKLNKFNKNNPFLKSGNANHKVNLMNYLQSIPFKINQNFLNSLMKFSFNDIPDDYKKEISLKTYCYDTGINKYTISNNENMKQFLLALFVADIYQFCPSIYFTNFYDNRHRLYLSGFPLNYQSDKLFRNLFINIKAYPIVTELEKKYYKDYLNAEKDPYVYKNLIENSDTGLYNFDAVSSVFQISGGLSFCSDILKRTGVIVTDKEDAYTFLANKLLNTLDFNLIQTWYIEYFNTNVDSDNFMLPHYKEFMSKIKDSINRKMVKSHLMPYTYSKTQLSMIKTYKNNEFIKNLFMKNFRKQDLLYKIIKLIISTLIKCFKEYFPNIDILMKIFGKLSNLGIILNSDIFITANDPLDNDSGIQFPWFFDDVSNFEFNDIHKENKIVSTEFLKEYHKEIKKIKKLCFYQSYLIPIKRRFRRSIGNKRYTITINDFDKNINRNAIKNKQALAPNIIQYLDSQLLYSVIAYCKLSNIPLMVIHDCFSSPLIYYEEIRKAYSIAFYEIVCKNGLRNIVFNALRYYRNNEPLFDIFIRYISKKSSTTKKILFDLDFLKKLRFEKKKELKTKFLDFYIQQLNISLKLEYEDNAKKRDLLKKISNMINCLYSLFDLYLSLIEHNNKNYRKILSNNLLKKVNNKILSN